MIPPSNWADTDSQSSTEGSRGQTSAKGKPLEGNKSRICMIKPTCISFHIKGIDYRQRSELTTPQSTWFSDLEEWSGKGC